MMMLTDFVKSENVMLIMIYLTKVFKLHWLYSVECMTEWRIGKFVEERSCGLF
jgi:hypothetical protein